MKIRFRLTLWYFSVTLLILLLFSLGIYLAMQRVLFRSLDQDLAEIADVVEQSYNDSLATFDILQLDSERTDPFLDYYLVIYNRHKEEIFRSALAEQISLQVPFSLPGDPERETLKIFLSHPVPRLHPGKKGEIAFRAINRELVYRGRSLGWITVARPIEQLEESLHRLLQVLLIAILIVVALIGVSGYLLTRKALAPVDVIARRANQISHSNLNRRIEGVSRGDELGTLAETLNNLLERLERAFESQQRFMADAAHELKTPLSVLRAHWEEELNNPELSLPMKEKLARDVETVSRLTHLINNLLLLSRTEKIQEDFDFASLRLDEVLNEVVADAAILAEMKEQRLLTDSWEELTLHGDRTRLYQLFFNIVDNAVKYTQPEGEIRIRLRREGNQAVVEIQDNGPGIPPEDLPHIFERFYRVKKDRARQTGGSGLGLSICQLIARVHGGRIEVESEPGKGSLFRIRLPLRKEKENAT